MLPHVVARNLSKCGLVSLYVGNNYSDRVNRATRMIHHSNSCNASQVSQVNVEPHLPTHIAAFRNDVNKLKHLMEVKEAPLLDEESLETPLHVAARWYVTVEW